MKNKRGAEVIHVYTPLGWLKAVVGGVTVLMLGIHFPIMLGISVAVPEFPKFIFIFLIPLYTWLLWYCFILMKQTQLVIYEDGIEIQRGASSFFSPWENMSHFGRRMGGKNSSYGIFLYQTVQPDANGLAEKLFYGWSSNFMALGEFVSLPKRWKSFFEGMTVDMEKLLDTEFGREVYRFAPHLFETEQEKAKNEY